MAKFHLMDNCNHPERTGIYFFFCPGCQCRHLVYTNEPAASGSRWIFNGDINNPTISPSLLIRTGHYVPGQENERCWCNYIAEHPEEKDQVPHCSVCHSFIRAGKIQFLPDCSHHLAGQTVDLPDYEETKSS